MSEFLLLGTRLAAPELSPTAIAGGLAALREWQHGLRCWGLLRSFAVGDTGRVGRDGYPAVCLVVRASSATAAHRLAVDLGGLGGYNVVVLPLTAVAERRGCRR